MPVRSHSRARRPDRSPGGHGSFDTHPGGRGRAKGGSNPSHVPTHPGETEPVNIRRTIALALAGAALITATSCPRPPPPSRRRSPPSSTDDGSGFDSNWYDYDILDTAVNAVLGGEAGSPLAAAADPATAFTVFAPNDRAFQVLVASLTGKWYWTEAGVTNALIAGASAARRHQHDREGGPLPHLRGGRVDFATAKTLSGKSIPSALRPDDQDQVLQLAQPPRPRRQGHERASTRGS